MEEAKRQQVAALLHAGQAVGTGRRDRPSPTFAGLWEADFQDQKADKERQGSQDHPDRRPEGKKTHRRHHQTCRRQNRERSLKVDSEASCQAQNGGEFNEKDAKRRFGHGQQG
jgi:hypothetical protein